MVLLKVALTDSAKQFEIVNFFLIVFRGIVVDLLGIIKICVSLGWKAPQ